MGKQININTLFWVKYTYFILRLRSERPKACFRCSIYQPNSYFDTACSMLLSVLGLVDAGTVISITGRRGARLSGWAAAGGVWFRASIRPWICLCSPQAPSTATTDKNAAIFRLPCLTERSRARTAA